MAKAKQPTVKQVEETKVQTVEEQAKEQVVEQPVETGKKRIPEHVVELAYIVLNNAQIRRFTALGIINTMKQKGLIDKTAKCFVKFNLNKFAIIINGLKTEYLYTNKIFISSLIASFSSFAHYATIIIDEFIKKEVNDNSGEYVTQSDVDEARESYANKIAQEEVAE